VADLNKTEIDGVNYALYKLGAFQAMPVFTKLLKLVGPSLLKVIMGSFSTVKGEKDKAKKLLDTDMSEILGSLEGKVDDLFEKLEEEDFKYLCEKMLKPDLFMADEVKVLHLGNHFSDKGVFHVLKVLKFAIQVNFSDFLPESIAG
jgi:hypothetical protein